MEYIELALLVSQRYFVMRIGIISDTHDNLDAVREAVKIFRKKKVGLVLHLGDIISPFTLRFFKDEGINRLIAVYGNNCGDRLYLKRVADYLGFSIYEWPYNLNINGVSIVMLHGVGTLSRELAETFAKTKNYDVVLYGHTHVPDIRNYEDALIINPGEACGYLTGRRTLVIFDIGKKEAELEEF